MQLGINTHRSLRHGGQRKPISVDKMYSSKPCSTTLSGHQHRIHAIDPEEADNEKCRQNENNNSTYSTKRYLSIFANLFTVPVPCIPCPTCARISLLLNHNNICLCVMYNHQVFSRLAIFSPCVSQLQGTTIYSNTCA